MVGRTNARLCLKGYNALEIISMSVFIVDCGSYRIGVWMMKLRFLKAMGTQRLADEFNLRG